jgi:signal transduction histidine kinase
VLGGKLENGLAKTRSPYAEHAKNLQAKLGEMQEQLDLVLSDVESQASSGDTLISSLRKLGEHTQKRHGVTCNCNLSAIGLVRDRGLASHLFHIAREAVDYAMRHHQPSEISITITAAHRGGILIVRDNGNGLAEIDHEDIALVLMRTHAALIDAELARAKSKQGGNEQTCIFRAPGF